MTLTVYSLVEEARPVRNTAVFLLLIASLVSSSLADTVAGIKINDDESTTPCYSK